MEEVDDVRCEVCGSPANRYAVFPICDNIVCYEVWREYVKGLIESLNNKLAATTAEGNVNE